MKNKTAWSILGLLMVAVLILASCGKTTTTTTTPTTSTTSSTPATSTTTPTTSTSTATSTTSAKWWDKFGVPQYGGTITYGTPSIDISYDNMTFIGGQFAWWWDTLFIRDWTMPRTEWPFTLNYVPDNAYVGGLVQTWEMTDPVTMILHLRHGVYFQNKPPVNGRELTADDVAQHFARQLGNGYGYTKPSAMNGAYLTTWAGATATDKYTVSFKFKAFGAPNFGTIAMINAVTAIEAPESVKLEGGTMVDWTKAVGTGPWMLIDNVNGSSRTYSRNPNYWGVDERHPENHIPYADTIKLLVIPDVTTRTAALRAGKIDMLESLTLAQAQLIQKSNPELVMTKRPNTANSVELRCDTKPFTDINVRIALQMALDLPTIAKTIYQGTVEPIPSALVNPANKLFSYQYSDWPQSLKDEYAYNPTKAKQLLAAAGYPNGFDTNIVASAGGGGMIPTDPNLLLIIKDYFKAIGVNMEIREMEPATLTSFVAAGKHDQMVYFGMAQTSVPYPNNVRWRLSTNLASNYTYNMDKAYDALFNAVATSASFEDYKKAVIACDKYAFEKHWSVTTFPVPSYTFYAPRFKGVDSAEIAMVTYPGIEFARVWLAKK